MTSTLRWSQLWKYPGFGETRMKRICKLPELNARALALPAAS